MPEPVEASSRVAFTNPQVNLYAHDIEGSLRFYRDVLGLIETFRIPKKGIPDHVELQLGSFHLGVASFDALNRHHGIRTWPGPPRGEIALFTDDVDGAHGWATSQGAPSLTPPHDFGGYVRSAIVADPDGNPVVFTSRLPVRSPADATGRPSFTNHLVNLYAGRLDRSLGFYRDLVGFVETFRSPAEGSPDHVEMELGSLNLAVSSLDALERHHGLTGGGGPPRGEVVAFVQNVDPTLAWLNEQGVETLSPPHNFAGRLRGAWVADPDGNPLQLVARLTNG